VVNTIAKDGKSLTEEALEALTPAFDRLRDLPDWGKYY